MKDFHSKSFLEDMTLKVPMITANCLIAFVSILGTLGLPCLCLQKLHFRAMLFLLLA